MIRYRLQKIVSNGKRGLKGRPADLGSPGKNVAKRFACVPFYATTYIQ